VKSEFLYDYALSDPIYITAPIMSYVPGTVIAAVTSLSDPPKLIVYLLIYGVLPCKVLFFLKAIYFVVTIFV